jgi:outer membrane receptor for ferrienterochelin and colicins
MKILFYAALMLLQITVSAQTTYKTKVQGACGMCKSRIEEAALNTIGIVSASWDESTKILTITKDDFFNEKELHQNIANVGHDTDLIKSKDEVYNTLPACCNYKSESNIHAKDESKSKNELEPENIVQGIIYEKNEKGIKTAIIGANINWIGQLNTGAISRNDGSFSIEKSATSNLLVFSYMGYASDTLFVDKAGTIEVVLREGLALNEVLVRGRKRSVEVSYISPIKMRKISQRELTKAACCNLSESFDTNPAVDVSYTDAVTGTKQIEMLGLAGPYVQITRENMPDVRGLASIYGLGYIPGAWIESIQLNLGTGSVVNGFESIAGQINVEIKKPNDNEKLHINGYYGSGGRYEGNIIANTPVNDHFDTNVLFHYNKRGEAHDNNFDGFLDMPKGDGYSFSNNWKYFGENGHEGQIGFKITNSNNTSGQDSKHHEGIHPPGYKLWQANVKADRYEAWVKRGKSFLDKPNTSIGFQIGGIYYDQKSNFGTRVYNGDQKMLYANLIYQTIIKNAGNKISFGSSFQAEQSSEILDGTTYKRKEIVPGVFGEYTYSKNEKIDLVFGLRGDYHNNFGFFATPRFHGRYAVSQFTVLRASAGRGQRTANIIAENIGGLATARKFIVTGNTNNNNPYGLNAELAWNYGLNLTHDFNENIQYSLDFYLTNFNNQIVVDYDKNPQELNFYNLDGKSFSRSIQTQVDWTLVKNLDLRLAYRYNVVKTNYHGNLLYKPMSSPHRAFANIAYEIPKSGWKFDYTISWQSTKRLPSTEANPENYRLPSRSEAFFVSNAQITKVFNKKFEVYFGGENIFNFIQPNTIIGGGDPYDKYFDASISWGPVFGRMLFGGFRYKLARE